MKTTQAERGSEKELTGKYLKEKMVYVRNSSDVRIWGLEIKKYGRDQFMEEGTNLFYLVIFRL